MAAEKTDFTTINLPGGPVQAVVAGDLLWARGIKYAKCHRFQPPQPLDPWQTPIDCSKAGPICPQLPFRFEFVLGNMENGREQSEDCLRLTVAAPRHATDLPVIVWIHGGAYISGGADLAVFDTTGLAKRGAVIVSIQYRLGIFGYAPIDGVAPANLGLLDQIAALQWVQKNISAFGGDPSKVTIMGQSAGGDSVYSLMLADGTDDLFHRAIMISAPLGLVRHQPRAVEALKRTTSIALQGRDPRDLSVEELLQVQDAILNEAKKKPRGGPGFSVCPGQAPLSPVQEVGARLKQVASRVQILVGWTKDDVLPFLQMIPQLAALSKVPVVGAFILFLLGRLFTAIVFKWGAERLHKQYLSDGGRSSTFCFEWFPAGNKLRACHCIEMPLMFGGWATWAATPLVQGRQSSEKVVERLGHEVKDMLVGFARGEVESGGHMKIDGEYRYKRQRAT